LKQRKHNQAAFFFADNDYDRLALLLTRWYKPTPKKKREHFESDTGYYPALEFEAHMSFNEIARKMNISRQAAKQIHDRALMKIRKKLRSI
jgi:hypothetical protein